MISSWNNSTTYSSRKPRDHRVEREWDKHIDKLNNRIRAVKVSRDIKDSTQSLRAKPRQVWKRHNEFDYRRRKETGDTDAWLQQLRSIAIQESAEQQRKRREEREKEEQERKEAEREERRKAREWDQKLHEERTQRAREQHQSELTQRKNEAVDRKLQIQKYREEIQSKVEEERRRRRESRALYLLEKQSNYENKRLHYEGLMRARQSLAESRLQYFKDEKERQYKRYIQRKLEKESQESISSSPALNKSPSPRLHRPSRSQGSKRTNDHHNYNQDSPGLSHKAESDGDVNSRTFPCTREKVTRESRRSQQATAATDNRYVHPINISKAKNSLRKSDPDIHRQLFPARRKADIVPLRDRARKPAVSHWK